jgi:hypothetical protein
MKRIILIFCVLCLAPGTLLFPQSESAFPPAALKLDLPLFALPYQIDAAKTLEYGFLESYTHPNMETSLAVTSDVYSSFHFGMKKLSDAIGLDRFWKRLIYYGGVAGGDSLLFFCQPVMYGCTNPFTAQGLPIWGCAVILTSRFRMVPIL